MESLTKELISNASAQLFPDNALSSFTNFSPGQFNLEGQWEVVISEIFYRSMYQNVTEGQFMFCDEKLSKSSEFYYLEPGLYPSNSDIVESMNILIQERHNDIESCMTVIVSRRTQKSGIYLANEGSGLAFFSADQGFFFGCSVGNEFGVMLRGEGPHKPKFAYDIVRIHSLKKYRGLIEYNIAGDTKIHCCVAFFYFEAQSWRRYNYWTLHELSDI